MFCAVFGNWSLMSSSQQSTTEYPFMYIYLCQGVSSIYILQLACCTHFLSLPHTYFLCNFLYKKFSHICVCADTHIHPHPHKHTHTHTHTHTQTHTNLPILLVNQVFNSWYKVFDSLTFWLLNVRLLNCLKMLGTNHPGTQYHIP